jgi:nucleotide-binding universal stress UspA family protein
LPKNAKVLNIGKLIRLEMFKKILFPTDFSECAHKVLEYLPELKNIGVEEIVLIRVINLNRVVGIKSGFDIDAWIRKEEKESEEKLAEFVGFLERYGIKAKYTLPIPSGDPVTEIVKAAKKEDVSLIIMGSRGKSVLKEIIVGSVSEGVVRRASVPVIIIKSKIIKKKDGTLGCEVKFTTLFDKILYAYDFSEHSRSVMDYVKLAAKLGKRDVVIVHVIDKLGDELRRRAEEILAATKREFEREGISVRFVIKVGIPSKEIIETARQEGASLIMMGSRGLELVEGMLLGSTTDAIVRHSEIPVFVYRKNKERDNAAYNIS